MNVRRCNITRVAIHEISGGAVRVFMCYSFFVQICICNYLQISIFVYCSFIFRAPCTAYKTA